MFWIYFVIAFGVTILTSLIYSGSYKIVTGLCFNTMRLMASPLFLALNIILIKIGFIHVVLPNSQINNFFCALSVIIWFLYVCFGSSTLVIIICHVITSIKIYVNYCSFITNEDSLKECQKINIKLFNKCFNINPMCFAFYKGNGAWYNEHNNLDYIIYDKDGNTSKEYNMQRYGFHNKVGIVCGFWCYWWIHDMIFWYDYQVQDQIKKRKIESMMTPISDHIITTLEQQLDEINKMIQEEIKKGG